MNHIISRMCNRRRGVEKTIAYAECHDQSIVGDKMLNGDFGAGDNENMWQHGRETIGNG